MAQLIENKQTAKCAEYVQSFKEEKEYDDDFGVCLGITHDNYYNIISQKINLLKLFKFDGYMPVFDLDEPIECSICLELIHTEYELCTVLCNHKFHYKCMQLYEQKGENYQCPMCRTPFKWFNRKYYGCATNLLKENLRKSIYVLKHDFTDTCYIKAFNKLLIIK
jgi:hypothetical protein